MTADETTPDPAPPATDGGEDADAQAQRTGNVLLAVFWVWAALLAVVTIAQVFGLDGVLDVLDVKRWFAR